MQGPPVLSWGYKFTVMASGLPACCQILKLSYFALNPPPNPPQIVLKLHPMLICSQCGGHRPYRGLCGPWLRPTLGNQGGHRDLGVHADGLLHRHHTLQRPGVAPTLRSSPQERQAPRGHAARPVCLPSAQRASRCPKSFAPHCKEQLAGAFLPGLSNCVPDLIRIILSCPAQGNEVVCCRDAWL